MDGQILHIVLLTWSAAAPPDIEQRFERAVRIVRDEIPGVLEASHGPSASVEGLERGYAYGLCLRFVDAAARDAYLPHPLHRPLSELITSHAETFLVFDLTTSGPA